MNLTDANPMPFKGRPVEFAMDRDLEQGMALAVGPDGKSEVIRVPEQSPPAWATKIVLSMEDYGRLLQIRASNSRHIV